MVFWSCTQSNNPSRLLDGMLVSLWCDAVRKALLPENSTTPPRATPSRAPAAQSFTLPWTSSRPRPPAGPAAAGASSQDGK